ncbi:hypothetical protein ABVT39_023717 [Epinephelus coioides]
MDECSFHHEAQVRGGVGVIWVNNTPYDPKKFQLGPQTSQYAEIASILIVLQLAAEQNVKIFVICADSNNTRLSFSCHLPSWKHNGFITSNRKPVRHRELFMACDHLVETHDMQIYWKKVRGHSRVPGQDKELNDQAKSLAKQGAINGTWRLCRESFPNPPTPSVYAVTCARAAASTPTAAPVRAPLAVTPTFSVSDLMMNHIFSRFGLPSGVDSDRGTHFTSETMQHLWEMLGLKANFHVSHHPQASGQVERANRTIVHILKKYVASNHKDWDVKLPLVLMAIRATPHQTTGVSPFQMMTGRQMTLPLYLLYQPGEANIATAYTTNQYMTDLNKHLKATFTFAQKNLENSVEGCKGYYDQKTSYDELQVGDKVWYYIFAQPTGASNQGPGKLARKFLPCWEGPVITEKLSPVVYQIQIKRGQKEPTLRWVHRNQIKPHKTPMGSNRDASVSV